LKVIDVGAIIEGRFVAFGSALDLRALMARISVVAPAYNEEHIIDEFVRRVSAALAQCGHEFEIVLVDDGSRDGTFARAEALHAADPRVKAVRLSRNFGQEAAVHAGLHFASGDAVVLMDSDLQDPPELVGAMLAKWREGFHVVVAERSKRSERWPRRAATQLFHWLFRRMSNFREEGQAGLYSLLDRRVVDVLRQMPERHRYLRGLRSYVGFRRAAVSYERPARDGAPRQSLAKLIRIAADGLFSFSYVPLRLSLFMGLIVSTFFFGYAISLIVLRLLKVNVTAGFTTPTVAIMFLGGVQLVAIGIIGEYLGRIYEEVKRRPGYVVERTVGLPEQAGKAST
jgi:dolichol-phosphate mannosyltransferase